MCFNSVSSTPGKFKTLALFSINFLYVPTFHPVPHLGRTDWQRWWLKKEQLSHYTGKFVKVIIHKLLCNISFNYSIALIGCSCLHVAVQHSQMGVVAYLISKGMVCIPLVKYCRFNSVFLEQMGQSSKGTVYMYNPGQNILEHLRNLGSKTHFAKLTHILPLKKALGCCYKRLFLLSPSPPSSVDCVELKLECITSTLHRGGREDASIWQAIALVSQEFWPGL